MTIKQIVRKILSFEDLNSFTEHELALVYVGQVNRIDNLMLSYYDSKYYDAHYYDSKYYDSKYYDSHYSEKSTWGNPYPDDPSGPHYSDSSYSNSGC